MLNLLDFAAAVLAVLALPAVAADAGRAIDTVAVDAGVGVAGRVHGGRRRGGGRGGAYVHQAADERRPQQERHPGHVGCLAAAMAARLMMPIAAATTIVTTTWMGTMMMMLQRGADDDVAARQSRPPLAFPTVLGLIQEQKHLHDLCHFDRLPCQGQWRPTARRRCRGTRIRNNGTQRTRRRGRRENEAAYPLRDFILARPRDDLTAPDESSDSLLPAATRALRPAPHAACL